MEVKGHRFLNDLVDGMPARIGWKFFGVQGVRIGGGEVGTYPNAQFRLHPRTQAHISQVREIVTVRPIGPVNPRSNGIRWLPCIEIG